MARRFRPPILLRIITVLLILLSGLSVLAQILGFAGVEPMAERARVSRLVTHGFLLYGAVQMWRGDRDGVSSLLWWLPIYILLFGAILLRPELIDAERRVVVLGASGVMIAVTAYLWWCRRRWDRFWGAPRPQPAETLTWHDEPSRD